MESRNTSLIGRIVYNSNRHVDSYMLYKPVTKNMERKRKKEFYRWWWWSSTSFYGRRLCLTHKSLVVGDSLELNMVTKTFTL